jgi:hypothetical protein
MAKEVDVYAGYPRCPVCQLPLVPLPYPPEVVEGVAYIRFRPCAEHPESGAMYSIPSAGKAPDDRTRSDVADRPRQSLPDRAK